MIMLVRQINRVVLSVRSVDWMIVFSVLVLLFFGMAAIYSVDLSRDATDLTNVKKQFIALFIAGVIAIFLTFSNYKFLEHYRLVIYWVGIILLIGVLFFGHTIHGARGWYVINTVSFQPVEYMKAALIVYLAVYFSRRAHLNFGWREIWESFAITTPPIILTLLQPDFGSAAVLCGIWFMMALFGGMSFKHFVILLLSGIMLFTFAWFFSFAPYQKARIATFFNSTSDPLGQGYNVTQSVIAIGAGGWFGRGLGFGTQSQLKFLPESQTDFIFAVIAEELGFVGVVFLLGAFILLFFRIRRLLSFSRDDFTSFLLLGSVAVIFLQTFVNIGMNLGIFPVTGIGLPFVSYGGSSIIFFLFLIGVFESIAVRTVRLV